MNEIISIIDHFVQFAQLHAANQGALIIVAALGVMVYGLYRIAMGK